MKSPTLLLLALLFASAANGQEAIRQKVLAQQLEQIDKAQPAEPVILRLDLELEQMIEQAKEKPQETRADWLAEGLAPQAMLYRRFGMSDLRGFARLLLGAAHYPHVQLQRDAFAGRDLSEEIRAAYSTVSKLYGRPIDKAPIYKVAYGYQKQTNAAMEGRDQRTERPIIILNRSALADGDDWDAAIVHETWHAFQGSIGRTLEERAIYEGVATYLTLLTNPTLPDHKALLWNKEKWKAAEANRAAIITAFRKTQDSAAPDDINLFLQLNTRHPNLPDAPDRAGYYVGLLACRAWHHTRPKATPADIIAAHHDEILAHLHETAQ